MPNKTSVNYSGRSIDLFIFQGAALTGDQKITPSFGESGGQITTGIQKLSQSFGVLFLTEKGSVPSEPDKGSSFVTSVRRQRIKDESDVQAEFNLAVEDVRRTLKLAEVDAGLSNDERFDSATLKSFNLDEDAGKLTLFVNVVSLAGTSRVIYLPIPVPIR